MNEWLAAHDNAEAAFGARWLRPRGTLASVALRILAVLIALAALVDPAITVTGAVRSHIAVVNLEPGSSEAVRVAAALARDLGTSFDVQPKVSSDTAVAVMVGRSYPADPPATGIPIATVTIPENVGARIARVSAPREVPPATSIRLEVDVDGRGVAGRTTVMSARLGGLEIARASHRWAAGRERWRAAVDAVPVGDPPYVIHVQADASSADVVVGVRARPLRVEFYEPRPSWATTFVRRALEGDARFQVESLTISSRGVAARTAGEVALTDTRLDSFDAVVVGGLDRLSATDVRALDRYTRERGGAVVLVPDENVNVGPARDLVPNTTERLLERPTKLVSTRVAAPLQASEILVMRADTAAADVLAATPGPDAEPVIVSLPRGAGRLVVSGAMDAWRFRAAEQAAFDRFWQSVFAGLTLAVPPTLDVSVSPAVVRPGDRADVTVRVRGQRDAAVSAAIDGQPLRLLPEARVGVYRGPFDARPTPGRSVVEARASGMEGSASLVVPVERHSRPADGNVVPALSMLAESHGGIDVAPDHLAAIERFVRDAVHTERAPLERRPMRSAWWMVLFTVALSIEWWLRRRRGLR